MFVAVVLRQESKEIVVAELPGQSLLLALLLVHPAQLPLLSTLRPPDSVHNSPAQFGVQASSITSMLAKSKHQAMLFDGNEMTLECVHGAVPSMLQPGSSPGKEAEKTKFESHRVDRSGR